MSESHSNEPPQVLRFPSFIPSFFEIKESAGREFFPKRIGVCFLNLALIAILNAVGVPPELRPSGGADEPGTRQW
jgi:hypothetical protein